MERRAAYFAFQGLFMSVLMLLVFFEGEQRGLGARLGLLAAATVLSLVGLRLASERLLANWRFQAGLFLVDAGLAALALHWRGADSRIHLLLLLLIFGTAITRSVRQSVAVGVIACALYLFIGWSPAWGFPREPEFWLRLVLMVISTALLAMLSLDTQRAQREQERLYQERIIQFERMATLGQVAGEVAHRIKGPLTTIMVNAEVLAHRLAGSKEVPEAGRELEEIRSEAARCKEILKDLLDLGRIEEMDLSPIDLSEPVRLALGSLDAQLRRAGARVECAGLDARAPVRGDQSLLQEAVAAVLQNAVESIDRGGWVRVRLGPGWGERGERTYQLEIEDSGKGIAPGDLARIFQPFFTTKSDGSGLGLSAALRILQKHGGTIVADSDGPGRGARFTISLPAA